MFKVLLDSFISALIPVVIILGVVGIIGVTITTLWKTSWWKNHFIDEFPEFHYERCFKCNLESCKYCSLTDNQD